MADITKVGTPTVSTVGPIPGANKLPTLTAGEAIAAGDACYIASDGLVKLSDASAGDALSMVHGFAPYAVASGETITLVFNVCFRYGSGLTPGAKLFLSVTTGGLADAASAHAPDPIGFVVDATRIYVRQSTYVIV
jgi:hypothetical protein